MIVKTGQVITIPVAVKILKPFAYEDRIYYIAKPVRSITETIWVVTTDGDPLELNEDILEKAYLALSEVNES